MTDDFDRDPVAAALRASLTEHARQAPSGEMLTERIIHAADRQQPDPGRTSRRVWRTWALPLVAAGAVAGVVAAVVGIESYHPAASERAPAASHATERLGPLQTGVATLPTRPASPTSTSDVASSNPQPIDTSTLHDVQVLDLTFAGTNDGWALGSADCIQGSGRCTALLRTTDGSEWKSMPGAAFNVPGITGGCSTACVDHLRFATDDVGYAWGDKAFFMTTNGGQDWTDEPGGATGLETLDGVVVRVLGGTPEAPCAPCRVETAPVGSRTWTSRSLPVDAVDLGNLGFAGTTVILTATRGPADFDLLVSADHGRTWIDRGRPCESSLTHVSGAPDGTIAAECAPHQAGSGEQAYTTVSVDGGRNFGAQRRAPRQTYGTSFAAVSAKTLLISYDSAGQRGVLYRSGNGGQTWTIARTATRPSIDASYEVYGVREFLGFESGSTGRWVSGDQQVIGTTNDGGKTWTETTLG
jgi:photosystem II stability/assembly factor-like uncharacterized protein